MTRRLAACVLLILLVGSVFDRCLVTCLSVAQATDAAAPAPACHHEDTAGLATSAQPGDGVFVQGCEHDHRSDAIPAELTGTARSQDASRALLAEVPRFSLGVVDASSERGPVISGPPLLVLDSGSDRRQLRL